MTRTTEQHGEDLAGRVAAGREKILEQLRLVIVGQDEFPEGLYVAAGSTQGVAPLTRVP